MALDTICILSQSYIIIPTSTFRKVILVPVRVRRQQGALFWDILIPSEALHGIDGNRVNLLHLSKLRLIVVCMTLAVVAVAVEVAAYSCLHQKLVSPPLVAVAVADLHCTITSRIRFVLIGV